MTITIPGKPYPLRRPRRAKNGGMFDPVENREAKKLIGMIARQQVKQPYAGPVEVHCLFKFARPKSHSKTNPPPYHQTKPDVDNLVKTVLDAMSWIVWEDDKQVVSLSAAKVWTTGEAETIVQIVKREES